MISTWRKTRGNARPVSWDELRTRVRQGVSKRLDLARYRSGLLPRAEKWNGSALEAGRFLFTADELPRRTSLLREHLPAEVKKIIQEAEELCDHHFRLLGHPSLDYGREIDWHRDAAHGKRTPLSPWYKIRFLDFSVAGDHKVTWELNRHQHLVTLAKAWALSGEEKYVAELVGQWYGWQRANPFPLGVNWASSLEVAFRSLSWLWVRSLVAECSGMPAAFEPDLLRALALNGAYIERYLSTYFSPNTHLLGEAAALFFIGTLCPQLPDAKRWQTAGWSILLREAGRQVHGDGVYFEQSLYYHVYALDFFLHARVLAARNGIETPAAFDETLQRMLDVLFILSRIGPPHGFGDDDGGRVFNPRRNRCEHLADPLALGAVLFEREDLVSATALTEEALWLFSERAVKKFAERPCGRGSECRLLFRGRNLCDGKFRTPRSTDGHRCRPAGRRAGRSRPRGRAEPNSVSRRTAMAGRFRHLRLHHGRPGAGAVSRHSGAQYADRGRTGSGANAGTVWLESFPQGSRGTLAGW